MRTIVGVARPGAGVSESARAVLDSGRAFRPMPTQPNRTVVFTTLGRLRPGVDAAAGGGRRHGRRPQHAAAAVDRFLLRQRRRRRRARASARRRPDADGSPGDSRARERGRAGAAHRLRERREPAALARRRAPARADDSRGARRQPRAARATAPDREPRCCRPPAAPPAWRSRGRWCDCCRSPRRRVSRASKRSPSTVRCWRSASWRRWPPRSSRDSFRRCAARVSISFRRFAAARARSAPARTRTAPPAAPRPAHRRGRVRRRAHRRRVAARAQLSAAHARRCGLRRRPACR